MFSKIFSKFVMFSLIAVFASLTQVNAEELQAGKNFKKIDSKLVCMVNDKFMGIEQIPIEADGKTYYGCCNNCIEKINKNLNNVRYSTDPHSGEKVDKALAFIVEVDSKTHQVKYFKNEANFNNYVKRLSSE